MTDTTTAFFRRLETRGHEPVLKRATGTLRFDLTDGGKQTARWVIAIEKGNVVVSHKNTKADCVVRAERTLFDRIASGKENAMAAVLRGALNIEGDPALLVWFQRLLPSPPRSAR